MVPELYKVMHNLVLEGPMSARDLAAAVQKPYSTLLREVNPYDTGAKLGADTLLLIMQQTGNVEPLEYMAMTLGYKLVPSGASAHSSREGARRMPMEGRPHSARPKERYSGR